MDPSGGKQGQLRYVSWDLLDWPLFQLPIHPNSQDWGKRAWTSSLPLTAGLALATAGWVKHQASTGRTLLGQAAKSTLLRQPSFRVMRSPSQLSDEAKNCLSRSRPSSLSPSQRRGEGGLVEPRRSRSRSSACLATRTSKPRRSLVPGITPRDSWGITR